MLVNYFGRVAQLYDNVDGDTGRVRWLDTTAASESSLLLISTNCNAKVYLYYRIQPSNYSKSC